MSALRKPRIIDGVNYSPVPEHCRGCTNFLLGEDDQRFDGFNGAGRIETMGHIEIFPSCKHGDGEPTSENASDCPMVKLYMSENNFPAKCQDCEHIKADLKYGMVSVVGWVWCEEDCEHEGFHEECALNDIRETTKKLEKQLGR
jgi:hypothetical protein